VAELSKVTVSAPSMGSMGDDDVRMLLAVFGLFNENSHAAKFPRHWVPVSCPSIISSILGIPENDDGENERRLGVLARGLRADIIKEGLRVAFFYISNNTGSSDGREGPMWRCPDFWRGLQTILETTGILQESVSLLIRNAKDHTASAFIEKLFTAVVFALTFCEAESSAVEDFYFRALRWVLQAGQDPNIAIPRPEDPSFSYLPIGFASESSNVEFVKILLEFGANPCLTDALWSVLRRKYDIWDCECEADLEESSLSDGDQPQELFEEFGDQTQEIEDSVSIDTAPGVDEDKIFDMLIRSSRNISDLVALDDCLLMSLEYGDISTTRKLCHLGANFLCRRRCPPSDFYGYVHSLTALSAVAGFKPTEKNWNTASPLPVQYVVNMYAENEVEILSDNNIVADSLIRAIIDDNRDAIKQLIKMGGSLNALNQLGFGALHVAASFSSTEACEFLLLLGAEPNCSPPGHLSPLHIACFKGSDAMVRRLTLAGANPDHEFDPETISSLGPRYGILKDALHASIGGRCIRPLDIVAGREEGQTKIAALGRHLLTAGAFPTTQSMVNAILTRNLDLLDSLLLRGAECNSIIDSSNPSMVHIALAVAPLAATTFLLLEHRCHATWDELLAAVDHIRPPHFHKISGDWAILLEAVWRKLQESSENIPISCSVFTSCAFRWYGPAGFDSVLESQLPRGYCSLALLQAVSISVKYGDFRLAFLREMLARRATSGRITSDVFEAAAVGAAAISTPQMFDLLLSSFVPINHCAISKGLVEYLDISSVSVVQETIAAALFFPDQLVYCSPVLLPIIRRDPEALKMIQAGYRPDTICLRKAIELRNLDLTRVIVMQQPLLRPANIKEDEGPLYVAVRVGAVEILQLLLDAGIRDYESGSKIALGEAIKNGCYKMVDALIAAKTGPHSPAIAPRQRTALQQAVESNEMRVVDTLLEAGVDVNQKPASMYGATALQLAAVQGHMEMARKLIEKGANINAPGARVGGRTALEAAAEHGRLDLAQMLLSLGFDTTSRQGRLAYVKAVEYAIQNGHYVLERMLRNHRPWTALDKLIEDNIWVSKEDRTLRIDAVVVASCDWDALAARTADSSTITNVRSSSLTYKSHGISELIRCSRDANC